MKSFVIINWGFSGSKLEALGYLVDSDNHIVHNDKGEGICTTAKDIFDNGLNVMLVHKPDGKPDILEVDNILEEEKTGAGPFGQR